MKANFKREVKKTKTNITLGGNEGKRPLLSRVVDPPGTKDGPRARNFAGPPKNTFCPRWSHDPDKRPFCPGWWLHPGQKGGPFVPGGGFTRDKRPPPIYFLPPSPFPQTLGFLICAWCRRRPLLPPPREPNVPD